MALTVVFDIGAGDDITADNDLTFKIYDGAVLHHTTGSVNSDANVSISGSQVTIVAVPATSGQVYNISVASVDEAGNESTKSNTISVTASPGTLIYQNTFDGGVAPLSAASGTLATSGGNLRIEGDSGLAGKGFSLNNTNFNPPDNVNFDPGEVYAFEIDVASFGANVITANNTVPTPVATPQNLIAGTTLRWERTGVSNGSFQILFFRASGENWETGDFVEISELRVYKV